MKRKILMSIFLAGILLMNTGCTESQSLNESPVNSGSSDEQYVGDANVQLVEDYKQTNVESELQEKVLKKIEEDGLTESGEDLGGHF